MAQYCARDGLAEDWHLMHVGNLAVSGAGLVIMEATAVEPRGRVTPACLGIWNDAQEQALSRIVRFNRSWGGARMGLQLIHSGRKGSVAPPAEGNRELPLEGGGWRTCSPSEIPHPGRSAPHALDLEEMAAVRHSFADAARRADRAGFDLLEIHCAHGYLLHAFLSPLANGRSDWYGGSLPGRMRFPLEVLASVRDAWPLHKPLGVRISATDWVEGGWDIQDSVEFCRKAKALGCDYVAASSGGVSNQQKIPLAPGYQLSFAQAIRRDAGIPSVGVGLITEPEEAERALAEGLADLVALGRAMLDDPRWTWHAAEHLGAGAYVPAQYKRSSAWASGRR